jgi:threonylcarbamoyladenosine tRNA methylthiotransferase MtaB
MPKSFQIITLGCKVNQYESACLKTAFCREGWIPADGSGRPDLIVVNTCIVTQRAAHQCRQEIRKAIRTHPDAMVAAVGCYGQVFPEELSRIKGLRLVAGNTMKGKLPQIMKREDASGKPVFHLQDFDGATTFEALPLEAFPDRTRAFLKIQDGCESFCSYCIVPFARGPCRSLPPSRVLSMVEGLCGKGYREIVLTGIHLGKYGSDLAQSADLTRLLRRIGREGFPVRIRLSSLEPQEISDALVEMVGSQGWLCRHFHIPLQSGDDAVLRRMNRKYGSREFGRLIRLIHHTAPEAAIGVDVMAGFPGEDPAAHENTCALIDDLPVSYLHVFPFSPRRGTPAATYEGQIDPRVTKERAAELREIGQRKRALFLRTCLGKEFQVLSEAWHDRERMVVKGFSDNYLPILFAASDGGAMPGLISVRTERVVGNVLLGSSLADCPGPRL